MCSISRESYLSAAIIPRDRRPILNPIAVIGTSSEIQRIEDRKGSEHCSAFSFIIVKRLLLSGQSSACPSQEVLIEKVHVLGSLGSSTFCTVHNVRELETKNVKNGAMHLR